MACTSSGLVAATRRSLFRYAAGCEANCNAPSSSANPYASPSKMTPVIATDAGLFSGSCAASPQTVRAAPSPPTRARRSMPPRFTAACASYPRSASASNASVSPGTISAPLLMAIARHRSSSYTRSGVCLSCSNSGCAIGTSLASARRHASVAACSMPLVKEVTKGAACFFSVAKTARASFNASISSVMAPCSAPMASSAGKATDAGTPPTARSLARSAPRYVRRVVFGDTNCAVFVASDSKRTETANFAAPSALSSAVSVAAASAASDSASAFTVSAPRSHSSNKRASASANARRLFSSSVSKRSVAFWLGTEDAPRCSTTTAYWSHSRSAETRRA
mmetsp:Transcript_13622/g.58187  ORF Transcript_13622/g.58187 Transcript_13622/m.58187 type:complete len:337 (+) Transcript_13622:1716-2726(+)